MEKRILVFSIAYFPLVGGAEVALREIASRLTEYQFDIITLQFDPSHPRIERRGNLIIRRIRPRSKYAFPFRAWSVASRLHAASAYSCVWSIMANYAGFAALFFNYTHPDVPFLLTLQEGDPPEHIARRTRFISPLYRRIFMRADAIQAISSYLARFGKQMGARAPIHVVPNGVSVELFSAPPPAAAVAEVDSNISYTPSNRYVVSVSRLVKKNGLFDLISALQYVPPEVQLVLIGEGECEGALRDHARKQGVSDRVIFIGGVPHENLPAYFARCDVFVRPSLSEGLGNAFLEAMAAGVPVIGTAVGGIPDFLKDGVTGWICRVQDPKNIADRIQFVLDPRNGPHVRRVVAAARKMVQERYSWDYIAHEMRGIFTSLITTV